MRNGMKNDRYILENILLKLWTERMIKKGNRFTFYVHCKNSTGISCKGQLEVRDNLQIIFLDSWSPEGGFLTYYNLLILNRIRDSDFKNNFVIEKRKKNKTIFIRSKEV